MPGSLKQNARLLERADQEARHVWSMGEVLDHFGNASSRTLDWPAPLEVTVRQHFPQLDGEIARARRDMGEAKWSALKGEWPNA